MTPRGILDDGDDDPVVIRNVQPVRETGLALLVELGRMQHWIPKSVIHDDSEIYELGDGAPGKLVIAGWFARKEGISE
jgi:hypothetical protein